MLLKYDEGGIAQRPGRSNAWKNQSIFGVADRMLRHVEYDFRWAPHTPEYANIANLKFSTVNHIILGSALLLGLVYIGVMPRRERRTAETDAIEFALLLLLMLIFTPLSFGYLYVWLLYPLTVIAHRLMIGAGAGLLRWTLAALALLALMIPNPRMAQTYGSIFFVTLLLFIGLANELWRLKGSSSMRTPFVQLVKRDMPSGKIICIALWSIVLAVILIRIVHTPERNNVLPLYISAGQHWLHGEQLYKGSTGFVYSPIIAAMFTPMSLLPMAVSAIVWRILITGVYLAAVWRWLEAGFYPGLVRDRYWIVFLLLLPLSIGNINNGQVNTIVISLLMLGIVMAHRTQWWIAAFSIAGTVYLKIYPLAVAMLVMVVFPKKFSWRFLAALVVIGAVTFILQKPAYVRDQYQLWIATRASDNRHLNQQNMAPRDLWLLLRALGLYISEHLYVLMQILSGCAVGVVCLFGRLRRWEQGRLLTTLLSLGCVWMLLCGPATESATYLLLAPVIACALCQAYLQSLSLPLRILVTASYGMLLVGLGINTFLPQPKTYYAMSLQPFGVLIFLCFIVMTLLRMRPPAWRLGAKP